MENCIFCSIAAGNIPCTKGYEDEHVLAIKDIAPKAPIHYVIFPKKHCKDISALPEEDLYLVSKMAYAVQNLSRTLDDAQDYRLVINNGYKAGQRVFHVHMHFLAGRETSDL